MSKCTKLICDLCGQHIEYKDAFYNTQRFSVIKFKAKKYWHSFHEDGWEKRTIHICPYCQIKISKFLRSDNNG